METTVLVVFGLVYLGMLLGGLPGLALDRTGIALLGAIALVATGAVTPRAAWNAIDVPTIALLFGMMVISANLRVSGFYARISTGIAELDVSTPKLFAILILVAGALSAVLTNDVVCLALAPLLLESSTRRGVAPIPLLLALCCASNVGSAATLIGNPQNILVGQALGLDFARYTALAAVPVLIGLGIVWWVCVRSMRGAAPPLAVSTPRATPLAFDRAGAWKAGLVTVLVMAAFLFTDWPREITALAGAGLLLVSRRNRSREVLAQVDGQLLVLFMGLFVVNHALADSGLLERGLASLRDVGIDPSEPRTLFAGSAVLSNLVSNVPATMLLLPTATHPLAGPILALASTLAGNFILVGSIANIIVVDAAGRAGIEIGWREHARIGVPVTLLTLLVAALWMAFVWV
ncbi:MAG: anion transporter [Planctomycetes bacterium]|nr:anion transporter [Planctomycetota bacterium]